MNFKINRRQFLGTTAVGAASLVAPALVKPSWSNDGFLELVAGPSQKRFLTDEGGPSQLWTFNQSTPGPEIRIKRGERVKVRLVNNLPQPTSIHWHGIRIDNSMDGVSGLTQEAVPPGENFEYDFVAPDAGTFWYHSHNRSWEQVARGLYGPLIVDDEQSLFDRSHDLSVVIDDWRLNQSGVLDIASLSNMMDWSHAGRLGNWITVNGEFRPQFTLKTGEAYRLRLINAANSRVFEIDPNRIGAQVIAYDGMMLDEPYTLPYEPLLLGPGQRVDLLFVPKAEGPAELEEISSDKPYPFALFNVVKGGEGFSAPELVSGSSIARPDLATARKVPLLMQGGAMGEQATFYFQGRKMEREDFFRTKQVWAFNGNANLSDKPLFTAKRGETIIIETNNRTAFLHAMHVHGHHFQVISRSGSDVDEKPWRDTFVIGPEQITRIAFVADNPGKWLLHCHMLEHAAAGMNTWFEVT